MKDALLFIVTKIVDHPDDVEITEEKEGSRVLLTVKTHPEDTGKVIGKSGRIIRAVRDLMKILAAKEQVFVDVAIGG